MQERVWSDDTAGKHGGSATHGPPHTQETGMTHIVLALIWIVAVGVILYTAYEAGRDNSSW